MSYLPHAIVVRRDTDPDGTARAVVLAAPLQSEIAEKMLAELAARHEVLDGLAWDGDDVLVLGVPDVECGVVRYRIGDHDPHRRTFALTREDAP